MKDIKSIIDETFSAMCKEYDEVFKIFYPAQGSAGFNEANQVQKFMFHYKQTYPSSIVWTELSIGEKKDGFGRLDGVIIDIDNDALVIIEAKRFNQPKKLDWSVDDINRATELNNAIFHLKDIPLPTHRYALVLGDIWAEGSETDRRRQWIKQWIDNNPLSTHKEFNSAIRTLQHRCSRSQSIPNYHLVYSLFECTNNEARP